MAAPARVGVAVGMAPLWDHHQASERSSEFSSYFEEFLNARHALRQSVKHALTETAAVPRLGNLLVGRLVIEEGRHAHWCLPPRRRHPSC